MRLGAIVAEKTGLVVAKVLLQKLYLRFPREIDFSLLHGATQSRKSLYRRWFGLEAQEKHFQDFNPWSTQKVGKISKMPIFGHVYPWDTKAHII